MLRSTQQQNNGTVNLPPVQDKHDKHDNNTTSSMAITRV